VRQKRFSSDTLSEMRVYMLIVMIKLSLKESTLLVHS
jgi:hypothetical protein